MIKHTTVTVTKVRTVYADRTWHVQYKSGNARFGFWKTYCVIANYEKAKEITDDIVRQGVIVIDRFINVEEREMPLLLTHQEPD